MKKHLKAISTIVLAAAALVACNKEKVVESVITPDKTSIVDIQAESPSAEAIILKTNTQWMVMDVPSWLTVEPMSGYGDAILTVTPTANYKNANTEMLPRSAQFRIIGNANSTAHQTGISVTVTVSQLGFTPVVDPSASIGGIPSLEEFLKFADAASTGGSVTRWTNSIGEVELQCDIDLSAEGSWTPIGQATASNAGAVEGNPFTGIFDGKDHTVKGLKIDVDSPVLKGAYGLFGVVQGGTVKNLNVETSGITIVNPDCSVANTVHIGTVVGALVSGTVSNCTTKTTGDAAVSDKIVAGTTGLQMLGGICGSAYASTVEKCTNGSKLLCYNETNTNNGGTGVSMGGIVGYSNGECTFTSCTNNAQLGGMVGTERWGGACRLGGFVGTTQGLVKMTSCVNNGNVIGTCICTSDKTSRTAGFVAYVNTAASEITSCVNNGDICFAPAGEYGGYLGGMIGQIANAFVIDGCETHGAILGDLYKDGHFYKRGDSSEVVGTGLFNENVDTDTFPEMGLVVGRPNSKATTVKNCKFSGKIGAYNDATAFTKIDASNFSRFMYGCTYNRRKAVQTNAENTGNVYGE